MIGYFVILSFDTKQDSAGAKVGANVKSQMDNNIDGFLYLPPYLRQNQSNLATLKSFIMICSQTLRASPYAGFIGMTV